MSPEASPNAVLASSTALHATFGLRLVRESRAETFSVFIRKRSIEYIKPYPLGTSMTTARRSTSRRAENRSRTFHYGLAHHVTNQVTDQALLVMPPARTYQPETEYPSKRARLHTEIPRSLL